MRRTRQSGFAAVFTASMLALVMASVPTAAAKSSVPLRGEVTMTFDFAMCPDTCHWEGPITGDIEGTIEFWETAANFFPGTTEHYFETMKIRTSSGVITGTNKGVFNFGTLKFRSNAGVEDASGDWAYLVGFKMHFGGVTTAFPPPEGSTTVTGTATWFAVPP